MPETRYATTTDGLAIAYQVLGQGPPNLVWVPGFASHVELFWQLTGFAHTFRRLSGFTRLALFDKRGTGLSDRWLGTGTLEERMRDVDAVMDAAGFDTAVVLGSSEGAGMSALFAATYPDRVDGLILLGGAVTGAWVPAGMIERIERQWGTGVLLQELWLAGGGELSALGGIERSMGTPRAMAQLMRANQRTDAQAILPALQVPTLVLHCVDDPVVPVAAGREMANDIPTAKLVELPGAFHGSNRPEDMDLYVDEIEAFVTGRRPAATPRIQRVLSTVLITDLVGSTAIAAAVGDARWAELLDEHDRLGRQVVARYGGRWIKSTGDGLVATFDGPARAVTAADELARELEPLELVLRAGVHTGEIELRGGDVGGIAVHIAARIAALAADGEVWVSATVPSLVVGSGLAFQPRGEFGLAGVAGRWELSALVRPTATRP